MVRMVLSNLLRNAIYELLTANQSMLLSMQATQNKEITGEVVCNPEYHKMTGWTVELEICDDQEADEFTSRPKCKGNRVCIRPPSVAMRTPPPMYGHIPCNTSM